MSDAVERPPYYVFPNGIETIQLSQWLTSAGGQAFQYIARATRIDGVVKENPIEDLHKAAKWIQVEIERLKGRSYVQPSTGVKAAVWPERYATTQAPHKEATSD